LKRYLGDGVYASFDGYHIWLGLDATTQIIALEPEVLSALNKFAADLKKDEEAQPGDNSTS
jgi:hypothetical protein